MNELLVLLGTQKAILPVGPWERVDLPGGVQITKLPGDASTRRYFRVQFGGQTAILMATEPFGAAEFPFLMVQKFLAHVGSDVPRVLGVAGESGMILLEDLGDVTLLHTLGAAGEDAKELELYRRTIDVLVRLQRDATQERSNETPVPCFGMRFDFEKLMWEVNFSIHHFLEKYLQRALTVEDRRVLSDDFGKICKELSEIQTVFTHRDFHSRNLMVTRDQRLVMIDFQDARLGPPQYDLVSLLRDSYYQLEESEVQELVDFYLSACERNGLPRPTREMFWRGFDLMTIQRNFKAIGTFAYVLNTRGVSAYLKYIGNTFENIRRALQRQPEFHRLREVLFHHYYF